MSRGIEQRDAAVVATNHLDLRLTEPLWHVWVNGAPPVGPVSADQIARGIRSGKVPSDARVRRDAEVFWLDAVDVADIIEALKAVTAESVPPPSVFPVAGPQPTAPVASPQPVFPVASPQPVFPVASPQPVFPVTGPQPTAPVACPQQAARRYLVWVDDGDPVGPVSAEQIARGIRAGKVPAEATLQCIDDLDVHDVLDEPEVIALLKAL